MHLFFRDMSDNQGRVARCQSQSALVWGQASGLSGSDIIIGVRSSRGNANISSAWQCLTPNLEAQMPDLDPIRCERVGIGTVTGPYSRSMLSRKKGCFNSWERRSGCKKGQNWL